MVASNPAGIACVSACVANFTSGRIVTLTAAPLIGSTFAGWSGYTVNPANARQCTVTMNAARVVTASFIRPVLSVAKAGSGSGLITGTGISCGVDCTEAYNFNPSITLTAAPAAGSTFVEWSGCTPVAANPKQCTVAMIAARIVTATFR